MEVKSGLQLMVTDGTPKKETDDAQSLVGEEGACEGGASDEKRGQGQVQGHFVTPQLITPNLVCMDQDMKENSLAVSPGVAKAPELLPLLIPSKDVCKKPADDVEEKEEKVEETDWKIAKGLSSAASTGGAQAHQDPAECNASMPEAIRAAPSGQKSSPLPSPATSKASAMTCRYCSKMFTHAPAFIQHERAHGVHLVPKDGEESHGEGRSPAGSPGGKIMRAARGSKHKLADGEEPRRSGRQRTEVDHTLPGSLPLEKHPSSGTPPPAEAPGQTRAGTKEESESEENDSTTANTSETATPRGAKPSAELPEWATNHQSDLITEAEKVAIPEFFCGRPVKTPERYIAIRRHLLGLWDEYKPHNYLKKTSCLGFKGDVNAISRVHTYLENIGAINTGLAPQATPPKEFRKDKKPKIEAVAKAAGCRKKRATASAPGESKDDENPSSRENGQWRDYSKGADSAGEAKRGPGQYYREPPSYDTALESERRRKRQTSRSGPGSWSVTEQRDTENGYGGGPGVMCLMLPWGERVKQHRVMQTLQTSSSERMRQNNQRDAERAEERERRERRERERRAEIMRGGDGTWKPQRVLPNLDVTTLRKYRRQYRLDLPLQTPKTVLAESVVSHFIGASVPEEIVVQKFIEIARRKRLGQPPPSLASKIAVKNMLQNGALEGEGEGEEEAEEEGEEEAEEEVYTIVQQGKRIEFTVGATINVLYDEEGQHNWYPGEIIGWTETTGKFRVKLTDGSNTRFSEYLPNNDVLITSYKTITDESERDPEAIEPPPPPAKSEPPTPASNAVMPGDKDAFGEIMDLVSTGGRPEHWGEVDMRRLAAENSSIGV